MLAFLLSDIPRSAGLGGWVDVRYPANIGHSVIPSQSRCPISRWNRTTHSPGTGSMSDNPKLSDILLSLRYPRCPISRKYRTPVSKKHPLLIFERRGCFFYVYFLIRNCLLSSFCDRFSCCFFSCKQDPRSAQQPQPRSRHRKLW